MYTCGINVLQSTRTYVVLTHVKIVKEGTYTEGVEVDIWGRVGGGGVLLLPLGDVSSWKVTNGDNKFLRNSSPCVSMYTASYFRRLHSY